MKGHIEDCCVHGYEHSGLLKVKELPATIKEPCFEKFVTAS
jgi:hypothetical protein